MDTNNKTLPDVPAGFELTSSFGGKSGEPENALMNALRLAAREYSDKSNEEASVYDYMENSPRSSFIVEVNQCLNRLGYKIVKK